jgi:3-oxoacyl-[acyl-carrier protein] reductase
MNKLPRSLIDVAVITGAGQGIGKSVALDLGSNGVPVLCISKSKNAEYTKREIVKAKGSAESLVTDIGDYKVTEKLVSRWISKKSYKKIGVILAAAILGPTDFYTANSIKSWDACYKVNVLGNLSVLSALLPKMIKNKFGRIVAFAGGGSAYAYPKFPAYSATKTAMVRTVENIHEMLKEEGDFSLVCLAPGAVETSMLQQIRNSGGEIKTVVNISEPVKFINCFMNSVSCGFSGRFVHVRDNWKDYIDTGRAISNDSKWKLRRIEA